jgi:hypothetical protein
MTLERKAVLEELKIEKKWNFN